MCQNAQDSISLDLPWCLQCKNGTPLPPYGGSNSNDPLQHTRLMQCTQRSNRTQEHKPTHRTPCVYGHSQRCTKCSRGKMAQHMEQQDLPQDQSLNTSHVHVSTTIAVPNAHVAAPRCICICMVDVALASCRRKPLTV